MTIEPTGFPIVHTTDFSRIQRFQVTEKRKCILYYPMRSSSSIHAPLCIYQAQCNDCPGRTDPRCCWNYDDSSDQDQSRMTAKFTAEQ